MLGEESSVAVQSGSGGYAYFSNGVYDSRSTSYTYNVYGAPPNVCGTLHIDRYLPWNNGQHETTNNWICTNGSGQATKGPWTPSTDQTGQSIYIQWPNGTTTVGGDYKIDDVSNPTIWSNQNPGVGVPIPNQFNGAASDPKWGSGFKFGPGGWSSITATFQNVTTGKYYDGSGYNSNIDVFFFPTVTPAAGGFNISWSVTPPLSGHNSYDTYKWCVSTNDIFYGAFQCLYFYGPR